MEFNEWLRAERLKRGMTIAYCNRKTGINAVMWSRMEAGEPKRKDGSSPIPTLMTLQKISGLFEIPVEEICQAVGIGLPELNIRYMPSQVQEKQEQYDYSEDPDDELTMAFYTGQPPDVKRDIKLAMLEIVKKHQKGR